MIEAGYMGSQLKFTSVLLQLGSAKIVAKTFFSSHKNMEKTKKVP